MTEPGPTAARLRFSRALPVTLTIVAAAVWLVALHFKTYWATRHAGSDRAYYAPAVRLARAELVLRAVGLRRCAARTGKLPRTLEACAADMPRVSSLLDRQGTDRGGLRALLDEPWHPSPWRKASRTGTPPPVSLDYLGLPIIYRPGRHAPGDDPGWVDSSLTSELKGLRRFGERDLRSVPASPRPFALSSAFLQWRAAAQRRLDQAARNVLALKYGGLLGILLAGVVISVRWRGRRIRGLGTLAIGVGGVISLAFMLGGAVISATCYALASFVSSSLSRADRLAILDEAVKSGEVPPEVAHTARRYIEELPDPRSEGNR
jgi:hypothetical protein